MTSLALLTAVGPQNLFVLRQGLSRRFVRPVVAVGALSDVLLFAVGTAGVGAAMSAAPQLLSVVRWSGVVFLVGYGLYAIQRACRPADALAPSRARSTRRGAVAGITALTYLNPHVYLDVAMLGGLANQHGQTGRWAFWLGASLASVGWFVLLGVGAARVGRWLLSPRGWQALDGGVGLLMLALAARLAAGS